MTERENRRRFLRRVFGAMGAFFAVPAAATVVDPALREATGSWVDAGAASAVKAGAATRFKYPVAVGWEKVERSGYLVRTEDDEIVALSSRCTHAGCTVRAAGEEFHCPCHGGVFSLQGEPKKEPVTVPLDRFEVRIEGGQVKVKV